MFIQSHISATNTSPLIVSGKEEQAASWTLPNPNISLSPLLNRLLLKHQLYIISWINSLCFVCHFLLNELLSILLYTPFVNYTKSRRKNDLLQQYLCAALSTVMIILVFIILTITRCSWMFGLARQRFEFVNVTACLCIGYMCKLLRFIQGWG